ncbi:ATP-dependent lipid A-core flippase [Gammaproteobacteria bacterium]
MPDPFIDTHTFGAAEVYRRVLLLAKPYWLVFVFATIAMAASAATETAFAALMQPLLDGSFVDKDPTTIHAVPMWLMAIFIIRGVATFVSSYGMDWIGRHVVKDTRGRVFSHLLALPTRFYHDHPSGTLLSKLIYDVEQVSDAATSTVTTVVRDGFTALGLAGWMFYLSPRLTLSFLVMGPPIGALVVYASRRFRRIARRIQSSVGAITQTAGEAIDGHDVIKIFGGQRYEHQRFEQANEGNRRQVMKYSATSAASSPVIQFIASLALAGVIYVATLPNMLTHITVGTFMSFMAAMMLLLPTLKRLTTVNASVQRGVAAGVSIFSLLAEETENDTGTVVLSRTNGEVEYRDVSFTYQEGNNPALQEVSFTVAPGETVAFVGRSGSGKTTLVSLLARFYDPQQGAILLDGHELRTLQLTSLRDQIAVVTQHVTLFNDTIARNIAYGCMAGASQADIERAARDACALEFIEALPEGFNTLVGENGVRLSGGQRQRIAIARALLKDAPVLILDEATSALDTESERHIQTALEGLMRRRTTLVIAHRLSTIEGADRIVVMDRGRVVEMGNHAALLALDGHYAALYRLQFRETVNG